MSICRVLVIPKDAFDKVSGQFPEDARIVKTNITKQCRAPHFPGTPGAPNKDGLNSTGSNQEEPLLRAGTSTTDSPFVGSGGAQKMHKVDPPHRGASLEVSPTTPVSAHIVPRMMSYDGKYMLKEDSSVPLNPLPYMPLADGANSDANRSPNSEKH